MPGKNTYSSFHFTRIRTKSCVMILALLAFWLLLQAGSIWSQQTQREYIYVDGNLVSVETNSITPLAVNVTSPTSNPTYSTNLSPITLSGTLANHVGTTQVSWTNDRGGSGNCSGTTSWTCSGISMQIGQNVIAVSARDSLNNQGSDTLSVAYCSSTISPTNVNIAAGGGTGSVSVTCSTGCAWTAISNDAWITVTGGSSGNGNGTVGYSMASNTGSARVGTIAIASRIFTINQAAFVP